MLDKTAILKEAQKYLAKGAIDKAISELEKLVKDSPDGNTYNMIGDIYLKKGAQKSAVEYYQKAATFFRQEGFSQKAQALYKKALNINPADTDALLAFGEICEEKGMVAEAIKYYLVVADFLAKEGKKEKILDVYAKILSLSPANIPLRIKVADIYLKEGLKSDAAREFVHIARIHEEKEDLQKAREYFQKTLDIQPLNKAATLGLSNIFEKIGQVKQALDQMKDAAVLFPEDLDILFRCVELAVISDDSAFEKKCLQRITEKEPQNSKARRLLGELYLKTGERNLAWMQYLPILDEIILEQKFEDAIGFLNVFKSIDSIETGKRLVSLYKQLNEDNLAVTELIALGDVFAERGLEEDSRACYAEAEQINPTDEEVRKRLMPPEPELTIPEIEISESMLQQPEVRETVIEPEEPSMPEINIIEESPEPQEMVRAEEPLFSAPEQPLEDQTEELAVERFEFPAAGQKTEPASITIRADKTYDEVITEADIFCRYGLLSEAQKLLEGLKQRFPENIEIHIRLKSLYSDIHDMEAAVTECLILRELYQRNGDAKNAEQVLKDAGEINPKDPRLAGQAFEHLIEPTSFAASQPTHSEVVASRESDIEDYEEEIAEADFYSRQGLGTEAIKILERLQKLFPENNNINERLHALGQTSSGIETTEPEDSSDMHDFTISDADQAPSVLEMHSMFGADEESDVAGRIEQEETFELPDTDEPPKIPDKHELFASFEEAAASEPTAPLEQMLTEEITSGIEDTWREDIPPEMKAASTTAEPLGETEFETFSLSDDDLIDAREMPEPELDSDVLEIFQEFKKGLEKELGSEDSETHYNLGIAYKEMGLIDDAIKEFQTSRNDPSRFIQSSTMLGSCYTERGLYTLAIDVLTKAVQEMKEKDDSYWALTYELAEAYEMNKNLKEALDLFTGVYGWSAKFRNVSDKISQLRAQVPLPVEKEKEQISEKPKGRKDRVSYL